MRNNPTLLVHLKLLLLTQMGHFSRGYPPKLMTRFFQGPGREKKEKIQSHHHAEFEWRSWGVRVEHGHYHTAHYRLLGSADSGFAALSLSRKRERSRSTNKASCLSGWNDGGGGWSVVHLGNILVYRAWREFQELSEGLPYTVKFEGNWGQIPQRRAIPLRLSVWHRPLWGMASIPPFMSGDSDRWISLSPNGSTPYSAVDFTVGYPTRHLMDVCVRVALSVWFGVQL